MAEQGSCDTIPAPQNVAFRVEPRKLDGIKLLHSDTEGEYYPGLGSSDRLPEVSSFAGPSGSHSGPPAGNGLNSPFGTSGMTPSAGSSITSRPLASSPYLNSISASSNSVTNGSSNPVSSTSSHSAAPYVSAVALGNKITTPSPVPANARRLCMRHQRSADEGVSLQLQKVSSLLVFSTSCSIWMCIAAISVSPDIRRS